MLYKAWLRPHQGVHCGPLEELQRQLAYASCLVASFPDIVPDTQNRVSEKKNGWISILDTALNKIMRQIQKCSVCLHNALAKETAKGLAGTFVYHISNGFNIPPHFAKGYDLVF